jgi:hypothetical protein
MVGVEANAAIGDLKANGGAGAVYRVGRYITGDHSDTAAAWREVDGVAQEVPEDLLEAGRIASPVRVACGQVQGERDLLLTHFIAHDLGGLAEERVEIAGLGAEGELAAGDAGKIEQVIDEARLKGDIPFDHGEGFSRGGAHGGIVAQGGGGHEDGRERRAQLVRELGEEVVLREGGGAGTLLALTQGDLGLPALRDVVEQDGDLSVMGFTDAKGIHIEPAV